MEEKQEEQWFVQSTVTPEKFSAQGQSNKEHLAAAPAARHQTLHDELHFITQLLRTL